MNRTWVFNATYGGFNTCIDAEEHQAEITVQACTLGEAWVKVSRMLPLNTKKVELMGIR